MPVVCLVLPLNEILGVLELAQSMPNDVVKLSFGLCGVPPFSLLWRLCSRGLSKF